MVFSIVVVVAVKELLLTVLPFSDAPDCSGTVVVGMVPLDVFLLPFVFDSFFFLIRHWWSPVSCCNIIGVGGGRRCLDCGGLRFFLRGSAHRGRRRGDDSAYFIGFNTLSSSVCVVCGCFWWCGGAQRKTSVRRGVRTCDFNILHS